MKKLIQYYDISKPTQISVTDLVIDLAQTLPYHREQFGDENVAIYMDESVKTELIEMGIDCECIKTNFVPLDNHYHTMRWLSMMAMQTESFQICPIGVKVEMRNTNRIEVSQLVIAPFIPVLAKYGIAQTGGLAGGDIISVCDASVTMQAYSYARDVIQTNDITNEQEIQQLMGAILYRTAKEMNIEIVKR